MFRSERSERCRLIHVSVSTCVSLRYSASCVLSSDGNSRRVKYIQDHGEQLRKATTCAFPLDVCGGVLKIHHLGLHLSYSR
jgi:hypothetical protein